MVHYYTITGADPESFNLMVHYYTISGADPESFKIL